MLGCFHVNLYLSEWLSLLTAAGPPPSLATGPGLTSICLMALRAAIDELDVALGRTPFRRGRPIADRYRSSSRTGVFEREQQIST